MCTCATCQDVCATLQIGCRVGCLCVSLTYACTYLCIVCIYTHIHIHACMKNYLPTHEFRAVHVHKLMYVYIHIHLYIYIYACKNTCLSIYTKYKNMYMNTYVYAYIYMYICIYIYIYLLPVGISQSRGSRLGSWPPWFAGAARKPPSQAASPQMFSRWWAVHINTTNT